MLRLPGARVGDGFGAVEVDPPDVGLVAQQLAQRGGAPEPVAAGRGRDPVGGQPADDLAQRVPAVDGVVEDPPDDRGLGFEHLQPGRAVRVAGLAAVAVGGAPGQHLPGAGAEQLPAPVPLGDLRPLVLGDHALDLGEQLGLRVVVDRWGVGEPHADPVAGQLVEHDDLVGVDAGEPVRGQAPHPLDQPGLRGVAQRVQPGPVQPGPGVAVVAELGDHLVALDADPFAQHRELGTDGAPGLLALGGHPCVERDPHPGNSLIMSGGEERGGGRGRAGVDQVSSSRANPAANASSRGSSCGVHGGRGAPSSAASKTGSALGQAISPARPRRANRAATRLSGIAPVASTCARNAS